ncbi:MAG: ABC transporter substrate-binding protein [Coprococcus sp.]
MELYANISGASTASDDQTSLVRPIFEPLFVETKDGIEYYLADKLDISEDAKTYTIHLNEKANWSDGEPVTVDDILFTMNYAGRNSGGKSSYNTINKQEVVFNKKMIRHWKLSFLNHMQLIQQQLAE